MEFFASPSGAPEGDGTRERPWDLATALSHPEAVKPGDTIWLRGGVYEGAFTSKLAGTEGSPILVRQYPGERAVIDGRGSSEDALTVQGAWTWYWGFEVTNSDPERRLTESRPGRENWRRGTGVAVEGSNTRIVNLVIHDAGSGITVEPSAAGVELYGNLVFYNGWISQYGEEGRGIEASGSSGSLSVRDNVVFGQVREGLYFAGAAARLEGNIAFNNGILSPSATPSRNVASASGEAIEAEHNQESTQVLLRPNAYDAGRATIVVYNRERRRPFALDLSAVLVPGEEYELRDVENWAAAPVAAGRYDGFPLSLAMDAGLAAAPVGDLGVQPLRSAPEFAVLVLVKKQAAGAGRRPTDQPLSRAAAGGPVTATAAVPLATGPVISDVRVDAISHSQARVWWTTNVASDTQIEYGTTTAYGKLSRLTTKMITSHYWYLSGLAANTKYFFRVRSKTSAGGLTVSPGFSFTTTAKGSGMPALPQGIPGTAMPTQTGKTWTPQTAAEFQAALDGASLGDTIVLVAGRVYSGHFWLRNKTSGSGWIVIRGSNTSALPPPGTRVSPSHGSQMPKIVTPDNVAAIRMNDYAHNYRFIGIEFYPSGASSEMGVVMLTHPSERSLAAVPHHVVIDRCYIHGIAGNHPFGVMINSSDTAVIDSYISDFHHTSRSAGAIFSSNSPGRIRIENNYLESAGINVFFTDVSRLPGLVISDVSIRRNHIKKQLKWKVGDPQYGGIAYNVKNLVEFKNARRVLLDGNLIENNWYAAQNGYALLFETAGSSCKSYGCINNTVEDVTVSNNIVRHSGGAINIKAWDDAVPTIGAKRIRIYNNLFEDLTVNWGVPGAPGPGMFALLIDGTEDFIIDHNTAFQQRIVCALGGEPHGGFVFRNNITNWGTGIIANGVGNLAGLNGNAPGHVFTKNVLIGAPSSVSLPPGSYFPATTALVSFVNMAGGDYRLSTASPYNNAGTDGKDIGVDMDALKSAQSTAASPAPAPGSDSTSPTVVTTSPAAFSTVQGTVTVTANATDDVRVVGVRLLVDGQQVGADDTAAPYSFAWNTTAFSAGVHLVETQAWDAAGNVTTAQGISVTVNNTGSVPPATGANLIANPGFESGATGWQFADCCGRVVVATQPNSGVRALQQIEQKVNDVGTQQDVAVIPGGTYEVSGWLRTTNVTSAGAGILALWLNSSGGVLKRNASPLLRSTQPWSKLTMTLVAPAGAAKLRFRFYTTYNPSGPGTIWFDDASVIRR